MTDTNDNGPGGLAEELALAVGCGAVPMFDANAAETVLEPEAPGPGYWVGAPSVVHDVSSGRVLLSYRRRRPRDGSPDERGYVTVIAESADGGRTFEDVWSLTKHEVGTSSLERCCLRAWRGGWLLYASWESPPSSGQWRISVIPADRPDQFALADARPVLAPGPLGVDAVKDPYVLITQDSRRPLVMFISTFLTPSGPAPTSFATSTDGLAFTWAGEALGVGDGWDAYQARMSSVTAFGRGYASFYDGARSRADDTEEHCGLAMSTDLWHWHSVTPDRPLLLSAYATGSLRYVDVVDIAGTTWAYFERARPDGAHELCRQPLGGAPAGGCQGCLD